MKRTVKDKRGLLEKYLERLDFGDLPKWIEGLAFGSLIFTYYIWEKSTLIGQDHNALDALTLAVPQASVDYLLLKSGTEVGAGVAAGHITARGILEAFETFIKASMAERKQAKIVLPGARVITVP